MRNVLLFLFCLLSASVYGQNVERIELVNADLSEFDESINSKATRLLGNVAFRHENTLMYCDSAYMYREENRIEAFSNVRINQGDTLQMTGRRLDYDGNTRLARIFEDVVMKDRKTVLITSRLDYDMNKEVAFYRSEEHTS